MAGGRKAKAKAAQKPDEARAASAQEDASIVNKLLREIEALFPRFAVQTIPGVGHWMHAEAPDETIRVVRAFLDRDEAE